MSEAEEKFLGNILNKSIPKHLFKKFLFDGLNVELFSVSFSNQAMFKELLTLNSKKELNTLHYIVFDLDAKHITVLPFPFINGKLPETRISCFFPDGYQYFKFISGNDNYCYMFSNVANKQDSDKAFLNYEKTWIYGDVIIGSYPDIPDGSLRGLTFDKVFKILSTLELSNNYKYFVFYPPC